MPAVDAPWRRVASPEPEPVPVVVAPPVPVAVMPEPTRNEGMLCGLLPPCNCCTPQKRLPTRFKPFIGRHAITTVLLFIAIGLDWGADMMPRTVFDTCEDRGDVPAAINTARIVMFVTFVFEIILLVFPWRPEETSSFSRSEVSTRDRWVRIFLRLSLVRWLLCIAVLVGFGVIYPCVPMLGVCGVAGSLIFPVVESMVNVCWSRRTTCECCCFV